MPGTWYRGRLSVCLLLILSQILGGVPLAAQDGPPVAFTNVTVVDVDAGVTRPGRTVVTAGTRIRAEGPGSQVEVPEGALVVDGAGRYLVPGLWDMHTHATFPGLDQIFLPLLVANGVTGIREMFGQVPMVRAVRERIRDGRLVGPRIVASGHILDGRPAIWPGSAMAATAAEAERAVDSLAAAGADFIKVYSRLTPEAFRAAARAAAARGLRFAGHVPSLVTVAEASDLGQQSIEHLTGVLTACSTRGDQFLGQLAAAVTAGGWDSAGKVSRQAALPLVESFDPARCAALAARLARNGTWMVPTLTVLRSTSLLTDSALMADARLEYIPAPFAASWDPRRDFRFRSLGPEDWRARRAAYARQREIVTLLHRAGVGFLAGTDLANPYIFPGFSLHDELAMLVELGMTPAEALRTATTNPARFLSAADSLGRVAGGMMADLVLLDGNPLEDIAQVRRIAGVMANGRWYDREALSRLKTEAASRARPAPAR